MSVIILISIGFLVAFSAIGYLLYSSFIRKANNSKYWQQGKSVNKEDDELKMKLYRDELQLKAHKELIMLAVRSRNLVQKISIEVNNLSDQQSKQNTIQTLELHFLGMFLKENSRIIADLNNFETTHKIKLQTKTRNCLTQLAECMSRIEVTIQKIRASLFEPVSDSAQLSDFNQQISDNYNKLIEIHKGLIHDFQGVFAAIQFS